MPGPYDHIFGVAIKKPEHVVTIVNTPRADDSFYDELLKAEIIAPGKGTATWSTAATTASTANPSPTLTVEMIRKMQELMEAETGIKADKDVTMEVLKQRGNPDKPASGEPQF